MTVAYRKDDVKAFKEAINASVVLIPFILRVCIILVVGGLVLWGVLWLNQAIDPDVILRKYGHAYPWLKDIFALINVGIICTVLFIIVLIVMVIAFFKAFYRSWNSNEHRTVSATEVDILVDRLSPEALLVLDWAWVNRHHPITVGVLKLASHELQRGQYQTIQHTRAVAQRIDQKLTTHFDLKATMTERLFTPQPSAPSVAPDSASSSSVPATVAKSEVDSTSS